jgi:hypothetical protein
LGLDGGQAETVSDVAGGVARLQVLSQRTRHAATAGAAPNVISYVEDMIARGCEKLAQQTETLRENPGVLNDLCGLIDGLLVHASPELKGNTEANHEMSIASSGGCRMDGAEAALDLCRIDSSTAERFAPALARLARDPHPEVRLAIAHRLAMLWDTARGASPDPPN